MYPKGGRVRKIKNVKMFYYLPMLVLYFLGHKIYPFKITLHEEVHITTNKNTCDIRTIKYIFALSHLISHNCAFNGTNSTLYHNVQLSKKCYRNKSERFRG